MTKIDNSYTERLAEVLYDERNAINYKGVSIMLGVHVNIAKQMMYHFYKNEKDKGKSIYATYLLSGMLPRKTLSEMDGVCGDESTPKSQSSVSDDLDGFLVLICTDREVERYKSKFSKLFSVHIYSLSGFPLENYDHLNRLAEERLVDSEGRTPVDFSPIFSSAGQIIKENARRCPAPTAPPPSKKEPSKDSKPPPPKKDKADRSESKDGGQVETIKSQEQQKKAPPPQNQKADKDRLKSMFASAAAKPKSQPKAKPEKVVEKPEPNKSKSSGKVTKKSGKAESNKNGSETRKRKRIRDVLSSDSEGEEEKRSSEEEDSYMPESPLPKRMQIMESDSDDDSKETAKPSKTTEKAAETKEPVSSGRRRVSKVVSKSFVDEQGYLVTRKETVMVSEEEDEEEPTPPTNSTSNIKSKNEETLSSSTGSKSQSKKAEPLQTKKAAVASAAGKSKQSSLMSFFQKK